MSTEEERIRAYWNTPTLSSVAPPAAPPPPAYGPPAPMGPPVDPSMPAPPPGIDPSWLQGQAPPAGIGPGALPPVEGMKPGQPLFGGPPPPNAHAMPPAVVPPTMPPPTPGRVRQPSPISTEAPAAATFGPPVEAKGYATSEYAKSRPKGGGGSKVDDYWGIKAEQKRLLGTFDAERDAKGREGAAEAVRAVNMADRQAELSRLKEEDAAIAHAERAEADQRFTDHMAETERQLDLVRAKKIDPERYLNNRSPVLTVLGGLFGGIYQGINKLSSNPFLDELNREADRDIAAQREDLANERESVSTRMSLLGQMRSIYKDHELAELQTKNLIYEAAKERIAAEAARDETPIMQARTQQGLTAIDRAQSQLSLQIKEAAKREAAAQAAAAAAAARAARKESFDQTVKLIELGIEDKKASNTVRKDQQAQLQTLGKELSDEKLVNARKTINDLKRKLINPETGEIDGSRGIPGVGPGADFRESIAPPLEGSLGSAPMIVPRAAAAAALGLSPEERVGRQEWNRLFDSYKVAVTGAGAGVEEIESLRKSFSGAKTPAEQAAAIRLADEMLTERESRIKAGADPDVARYWDQRVGEERAARPKTTPRKPVD